MQAASCFCSCWVSVVFIKRRHVCFPVFKGYRFLLLSITQPIGWNTRRLARHIKDDGSCFWLFQRNESCTPTWLDCLPCGWLEVSGVATSVLFHIVQVSRLGSDYCSTVMWRFTEADGTCSTCGGDEKLIKNFWLGKPERNIPLGAPLSRWEWLMYWEGK